MNGDQFRQQGSNPDSAPFTGEEEQELCEQEMSDDDDDSSACSSQCRDPWPCHMGGGELSQAHAVIIGAGPGGMGPLIRAARTGKLTELLKKGLVWVDRRNSELFGSGQLGECPPSALWSVEGL